MNKSLCLCLLVGAALLAFFGDRLHADSVYKLDHRISMPGNTGWDYLSLDSASHRLYLTRGQQVDVLDLETEKIVGSVPGTAGVHGVAIAADLNKGFSSNGMSGTVTVFDLKTLKVIKQIPVGQGPDSILYDQPSQQVFVFNGKGRSSSIIDARKNKVVSTLDLGARPEFTANDGLNTVFVNFEDKNSIAAIDTKTLKVRAVWPLLAEGPSGLAMDREHGLLFAVCDGKKMEVVDAKTGTVTAEVSIGDHPDAAAFDPGTQLAFSSNGEGNLTVAQELSPTAFTVVDTVETQKGARTMALDPSSHQVYLLCARYLSPTASPEDASPTAAPNGTSMTAQPRRQRPRIEPGSVELLVLKKQ
jgi:YVTN family beta-propeller protein